MALFPFKDLPNREYCWNKLLTCMICHWKLPQMRIYSIGMSSNLLNKILRRMRMRWLISRRTQGRTLSTIWSLPIPLLIVYHKVIMRTRQWEIVHWKWQLYLWVLKTKIWPQWYRMLSCTKFISLHLACILLGICSRLRFYIISRRGLCTYSIWCNILVRSR